jgi:hypothetical protein
MKQKSTFLGGIFILTAFLPAPPLQQAHEDAGCGRGYERFILLNPNSICSGGLTVENEGEAKINCVSQN